MTLGFMDGQALFHLQGFFFYKEAFLEFSPY